MGFFKNIELEILDWKARGHSIEDTFIYFKDYVSPEALVDIWDENYDKDPQ